MTKRKKRFSRQIAVALTLVLLAGQSHLATFAQEENVTADTEVSVSENATEDTGVEVSSEEISSEEISAEETISGNVDEIEEVEEPEEALATAADGIVTYASDIWVAHVKYGILEQSGDKRQVQVIGWEEGVDSKLVIPSQITDGGVTWDVVCIAEKAFMECQNLVSVEIPGSVKKIGMRSFVGCKELTQLILHEGIEIIDAYAFGECSKLESVSIPDSVTTMCEEAFYVCESLSKVDLGQGIDSIPYFAFGSCSNLSEIHIPNSVEKIDDGAFWKCTELSCIEIPQSVTQMVSRSFMDCSKLKYMEIDVDAAQEKINPITIEQYHYYQGDIVPFQNCPDERYIVFRNADGTQPLSGDELEKAKTAYAADVNDGNAGDNMWYGWSLGEAPVETDKYAVTIQVRIDEKEWTDHGRTFALSANNGDSMITDLNTVSEGTYNVFDVTDGGKTNTDISLTVDGNDDTATVDYYTVTFCDENGTPYADNTDQKQQTVLKGVGHVTSPASNPVKSGHTFDKWVMEDRNTPFSFAATPISSPTKIYAKWTVNTTATYKVTINVKIDGRLWADHRRTFALKKSNEPFITDLTQVADGTYDIYDITGVNPDSYYSKAVDTGMDVRVNGVDTEVDVTVSGADAAAEINYYTATFYDGDVPYGDNTLQKPQIVLSGKQAVRPEAPTKNGSRFDKWVTQNGGTESYDFNTNITNKTDIFASWTSDPSSGSGNVSGSGTGDGGNSGSGDSNGDNSGSGNENGSGTGDNFSSGNSAGGDSDGSNLIVGSAAAGGNPAAGSNSDGGAAGGRTGSKEPKTGDATHVEVYATIAMIAGLIYLLLYFMEESRGMSEREKEMFVAALIRWAKKGGIFRKCCAMAAIFCLLVYYHSIGKRSAGDVFRKEYLGQMS